MTATTSRQHEVSREGAPGIHRVVMPLGERINSCCAFVGERRTLLYDTALDGDISSSVAPYLASIGRDVQDVSLAVVSTPCSVAGADFLALSRTFADRCDDVVLSFVRAAPAPVGVRDVVLGTAADLGPWPIAVVAAALGQPVVGHLECLTERGLLSVDTAGAHRVWSA